MPRFCQKVIETRTVACFYYVEANDAEAAKELFESGETYKETDVQLVEILNRTPTGKITVVEPSLAAKNILEVVKEHAKENDCSLSNQWEDAKSDYIRDELEDGRGGRISEEDEEELEEEVDTLIDELEA